MVQPPEEALNLISLKGHLAALLNLRKCPQHLVSRNLGSCSNTLILQAGDTSPSCCPQSVSELCNPPASQEPLPLEFISIHEPPVPYESGLANETPKPILEELLCSRGI